jgi:dTDP-4-dehydrorhamnose 3,5-epimerase-like enzyme
VDGIQIREVVDSGDARGSSFPLDIPSGQFSLKHMHVTTLLPGHTRGNHFHIVRNELLVIVYEDNWALYWDAAEGAPVQRQSFVGKGCVLVTVPPHASHAIVNEGNLAVHILGLADHRYDPSAPDTFSRVLTPG